MLMTQARIVLCFAVAAVCGFLEIRKGCCVIPILHVFCPQEVENDGNAELEDLLDGSHSLLQGKSL
jgi:hypothetical protein